MASLNTFTESILEIRRRVRQVNCILRKDAQIRPGLIFIA